MALGDGDPVLRVETRDRGLHFGDAALHVISQLFQLLPGAFRRGLVAEPFEYRVRPARALAHHMDGNEIDMLAGTSQKLTGPEFGTGVAVSPADQPDRRVALLHGPGELDGVRDRFVARERLIPVRRLVSDLPKRDAIGLRHAMRLAFT